MEQGPGWAINSVESVEREPCLALTPGDCVFPPGRVSSGYSLRMETDRLPWRGFFAGSNGLTSCTLPAENVF